MGYETAEDIIKRLWDSNTNILKVGQPVVSLKPTITVGLLQYTAGDSIGGKITLQNAVLAAGKSIWLDNVLITDAGNQKPAGQILIFKDDPTGATITDDLAFAWGTDLSKLAYKIAVTAADYTTIGGMAVAALTIAKTIVAVGTSLYMAFVAESTPTFPAGSNLAMDFTGIQW